MTEKFIKRHCEKCEFRLWSPGSTWLPEQCGKITKDGDGIVYGTLEKMNISECRKGYKK